MITRQTFKVGDKVCVVTRSGNPFRVSTVARIGKRKITLEDTSGWTLDGYEWGLGSDAYAHHIRKATPKDEQEIARRRLAQSLNCVRWEDLPMDALVDIARIVNGKET